MAFIESQRKLKMSFREALETVVQSAMLNFRRRRLYARTVSELNDLSVRELSDLGLSRSMIRHVAYSAVYEGKFDRDNQI